MQESIPKSPFINAQYSNYMKVTCLISFKLLFSIVTLLHSEWYLHKHDNAMIWNHFPHYWSCIRTIHQSLLDSPYKWDNNAELDSFNVVSLNKLFKTICWVSSDVRYYWWTCDITVMIFPQSQILIWRKEQPNWPKWPRYFKLINSIWPCINQIFLQLISITMMS